MPENIETDCKCNQNDRKDGEDRDESDQNLKRGNVTKHLKAEACLGEHWYVSFKSCKSRVLLEEEEELCPGEEDHESSQVTGRVAVEQTERMRKSMRGDLQKPGRNEQEKCCQEKNGNIAGIAHRDVLEPLNPHLLELLESHPESHDCQDKGVSTRSSQDCEQAKVEQKDVFKNILDTFHPVLGGIFAAYAHHVSKQQQIC